MKYVGSKNRIAKHLLPYILANRKPCQWYVEPFVGGGGVLQHVTGNRIASDINKHSIQALRCIRDSLDKIPQTNHDITEDEYKRLRHGDDSCLRSYIGYALSWGGKWFGGWRRCAKNRDYVKEAYNSAKRQSPLLNGVMLLESSYESLIIPNTSIVYCDIPYKSTQKYQHGINYKHFWEWCRTCGKRGHKVFISEYQAPKDFVAIWSKDIINNLAKKQDDKKGTEKLFVWEGQL